MNKITKFKEKQKSDYLSLVRKAKQGIYGNLLTKQNYVDCCKEFKFIRAFDTINFNNKMNRLGITHLVIDEDYNFTEVLENDIIEPIINRSNNVFGIIGKTGTGKSELAQTLSLYIKKANKDFLGRNVELFLCYTWGDFHSTLPKLKKGDIVWKDETPKTVGKGSRTQKWAIENVLHTIRKMENTFIFVDPLDIQLDLCDLYLESAGLNFKTKTNRFMLLNEKKQYFGHIYAKLHDDRHFRDWYETQKDKFIGDILNLAGKIKIVNEKEQKNANMNELNIKEKFLLNHFSKREVRIWKEHEMGLTFDEIASIYGFYDGSGTRKIWKKLNDFLLENFNS